MIVGLSLVLLENGRVKAHVFELSGALVCFQFVHALTGADGFDGHLNQELNEKPCNANANPGRDSQQGIAREEYGYL